MSMSMSKATIRGNQKKITTIIQKILHHEDFQQFSDLIEKKSHKRNPGKDATFATDFLFDDEIIQQYEGNFENFIHDLENCFRAYKKLNKTQNMTLWNYAKELIVESFGPVEFGEEGIIDAKDQEQEEQEQEQEQEQSSNRGKRRKSASSETNLGQKSSPSPEKTTKHRIKRKSHFMDDGGGDDSGDEVERDLPKNRGRGKGKGKANVDDEKDPDENLELPPTKKSRGKGKELLSPEDQELQKEMLKVIRTLSSNPSFHVFLDPVSIEDAPDYYEAIPYPMDLSTMKTNVTNGKYNQNQIIEYAVDMRRIGMNCMTYNLPGSPIYQIAEEYLKSFELLYQNSLKSRSKSSSAAKTHHATSDAALSTPQPKKSERKQHHKAVAVESAAGASAGAGARGDDSTDRTNHDNATLSTKSMIDEKKLQQIKKFFKLISQHPLAEPFRYPVDMSQAPGYLDIIKRPMDLSQIKSNFDYYANSQVNKLFEFYSDLKLIFDNCQTYNVDGSPLFLAAQELSEYTRKAFIESFPDVLHFSIHESSSSSEPNKSTTHPTTPKNSKNSKGLTSSSSTSTSTSAHKTDIPKHHTPKSSKPIYHEDEFELTPPHPSHSSKRSARREKSMDFISSNNNRMSEHPDWPDIFIEDKDLIHLSSKELNDIYHFLQSSEATQSVAVQERCSHEAKKFLKQIQTEQQYQDGSFYSNDLYCLVTHGTIRPDPSWHTKDFIYPYGYVCRRDLVLSVVPKNDHSLSSSSSSSPTPRDDINPLNYPHIQVTFTTEISEDENGNPLFRLLIGDNILVMQSSNPYNMWNTTLLESFGQPILQSLGQKLLRCRAILFYMCTCDSIESFLDQLPLFSTKSYQKRIKAPMWLNEVYNHLINGMYDNEYDFAWDMRLIFQNSMIYNEPQSEIYTIAEKLLEIFNILFCQWIQNVEDYSVFEPARGLWDDWMTLKYFDQKNENEIDNGNEGNEGIEVCKITKIINSKDNELNFCVSCEDFYHPSVSEGGLSYEEEINGVVQQLWRCQRCQKMKLALESNQYSGLLPEKRYIKNKIFKSYIYKLANELGSGWVKATTSTKPNLGKFLSPLGYQFNSKEESMAWIVEENILHEKLITDREEEFHSKQGNGSHVNSKKKKSKNSMQSRSGGNSRGRKRKQVDEADNDANILQQQHHQQQQLADVENEENKKDDNENPMVMLTGKLPNLNYEGSHVLFSGLSEDPDSPILKMTVFSIKNIPSTGFSGLEDLIIHRLIEGLSGSNKCHKYQFSNSIQILQHLNKTIQMMITKKEQLTSADKILIDKLIHERNYWKNMELETRQSIRSTNIPSNSDTSMTTSTSVGTSTPNELMEKYPTFEKNICQLLIPLVPPEWKFESISCDDIELAVHIWEFLHYLSPLVTHQSFGLLDVIKSFAENSTPSFPNPSSIIFDEICCLFTSVLMTDLSQQGPYSEDKNLFQDFLSLFPINSISWPWTTYVTLFFNSNNRCGRRKYTHHEIIQLFHLNCWSNPENHLLINELKHLFLCHPSFYSQRTSSSRSYEENLRYDQLYSDILNINPQKNGTMTSFLDEIYSTIQNVNDTEILNWFLFLLKGYTASHRNSAIISLEILPDNLKQAVESTSISLNSTNILFRSAHENLAVTLRLLRVKEPDHCSISERMTILHTLMQYCSATQLVSSQTKKLISELSSSQSQLPDSLESSSGFSLPPALQSEIHVVEIPKSNKNSLKCYFSGIESKIDSITAGSSHEVEWVTVPSSLLQPPVMCSELLNFGIESEDDGEVKINEKEANSMNNNVEDEHNEAENNNDDEEECGSNPDNSDSIPRLRIRRRSVQREPADHAVTLKLRKPTVCLKKNLIKFATARELAALELENMKDSSSSSLNYMKMPIFSNSKLDYITKGELLLRSVSLGFDRTGREYWLLDEQNRTLIGGYNQTYSQYIDDEPVILVREPQINTWSYICTSSVHELLDYLSSKYICERFLFKNITTKIENIRENLLKSNLKSKCSQDSWLAGFRSFEFWFTGIHAMVNNTTNPLDIPRCLKLQELSIARCLEFRLGAHYAFINKVFDTNLEVEMNNSTHHDTKKKLIRHKLLEHVYDCHSTLGWLRHDSYERIRELSADTIAIKLLCDPTFYEYYSINIKKSQFRKKNTHLDEIGANPRAYVKSLPSSTTVHTRQAANIIQSRSSMKEDSQQSNKTFSDDEEGNFRHIGSASSKSIEQLHIETGQILRRWPSGTKAAALLGVSRSGISVCCSGIKDEAFGFRWRFCDGNLPPIPDETPLKTLLKMKACYQKSSGTYVGLDDNDDTEGGGGGGRGGDETAKPSSSVRSRPNPQSLLPKFPPPNTHRQVPDVVGSLVPVSYRLLKLKIELLNILAILPKGLIIWNPKSEKEGQVQGQGKGKGEEEGEGEAEDEEEAEEGEKENGEKRGQGDEEENNDNGNPKVTTASDSIVPKEEEKSDENNNVEPPPVLSSNDSMEVTTSTDSVMTLEKFILNIQNCDTCSGLFNLIHLLEKSLSPIALFDYPFQSENSMNSKVDHSNLTTAMVGTYLYSLDRWIRYEDIPLDFFYESVNYRPRMVYTPRCILSPVCMKFFHHTGRCDPSISVGDSRYREIVPKGMQVPTQNAKQQMSNQFQKSLPPPGTLSHLHQQQYQSNFNQNRSILPPAYNMSTAVRLEPELYTLDSIQPYVPRKDEIRDSAWV